MTVAPRSVNRTIATPANGVTALRIALAPVIVGLIWFYAPAWWVLIIGFLAMITDQLDGWLARRYGATDVGRMFDPLADKVMVLGALGVLVAKGWVWWLPVAIIALREVAMSWWRARLSRDGVSIPARKLAKWKTWSQSVTVAFALAPGIVDSQRWLLTTLVWLSVALTIYTFGQYLRDGKARRLDL